MEYLVVLDGLDIGTFTKCVYSTEEVIKECENFGYVYGVDMDVVNGLKPGDQFILMFPDEYKHISILCFKRKEGITE